LTTVAPRRNLNLASTAKPFMTWSGTSVLSARHQFPAHITAAPTIIVVGIDTASSN
jgi:hypothetical protein